MNITLRKANAAQKRIKDLIKSGDLNTSVSINEFEDSNALIADRRQDLDIQITLRLELVSALYSIRKLVAHTNQKVGVNDLLADVAELDELINMHNLLGSLTPRMSEKVIEGKIAKMRHSDAERYSYRNDDEFSVGLLDKTEIEGHVSTVARLRSKKQKLQDRLLELNFKTEISLDATTVANLEGWDIV